MPLTILTDSQILDLLEGMTLQEAEDFRGVMENALIEYSVGVSATGAKGLDNDKEELSTRLKEGEKEGRDSGDGENVSAHQPSRTKVKSSTTGATSLFMPSASSWGVGVKVVTLAAPSAPSKTGEILPTPLPSIPAVAASSSSPPLAPPAVDKQQQSQKGDQKMSTRPTGAITLFGPLGEANGLLHARTLTAYRTALSSMPLLVHRARAGNVCVLGSGEQAYWHARLTLLYSKLLSCQTNHLDGEDDEDDNHTNKNKNKHKKTKIITGVKRVTLVSLRPGSQSADTLVSRLLSVPVATRRREGWSETKFAVIRREDDDYDTLLTTTLVASDVIFCCTPATTPLFDGGILTSHEGRMRGRLVVAIGSYMPHMRELPNEIIRQAVKRPSDRENNDHKQRDGGDDSAGGVLGKTFGVGKGKEKGKMKKKRHWHKHAQEGGVLVVDTLDGAMEEAGEVRAARLDPGRMVELGELLMLTKECRSLPSIPSPHASSTISNVKPSLSASSSSSSSTTLSSSLTTGATTGQAETSQANEKEDMYTDPYCPECDPTTNPPSPRSSTSSIVSPGLSSTAVPLDNKEIDGNANTAGSRATSEMATTAAEKNKKKSSSPKLKFLRQKLGIFKSRQKPHSANHMSSTTAEPTARTTTATATATARSEETKIKSKVAKDESPSAADLEFSSWLREGNVIYKCVGMGVMDLAVGMKVVRFAREKGVGTTVEGF